MPDAHVDLKVLENEKDALTKEVAKLRKLASVVHERHNRAAENLEGNQFDIATEETNSLISTIENAVVHMELLIEDVNQMIDDVKKYLENKYEG